MESGNSECSGRSKRFVVFPFGGTFKVTVNYERVSAQWIYVVLDPMPQLVIGIGIPVKLGSRQSMAIGWNFQYQYATAQNVTQLETYPPIISSRSRDKREERGPISDRELAYSGVESLLNRLAPWLYLKTQTQVAHHMKLFYTLQRSPNRCAQREQRKCNLMCLRDCFSLSRILYPHIYPHFMEFPLAFVAKTL